MQTLLEYAPWIVFGLVYKFGGGIYPATAALMIVMTLLLAYYWLRTRKVPQMHLALTIMVLVFGAATLILHDVRFLQWKASVDLLAHRPPVRRQRLDRQEDAARTHDRRRSAGRCHGAGRLLAQRFAADRRFLRAAGIREHLGRQDPQRSRLGHLQSLDRGARWR